MQRLGRPLVAAAAVAALLTCTALPAPLRGDERLRARATELFAAIEAPPAARLDEPDVALGRALFWDPRVSGDGRTACASCHAAEDGGADRRRFSPDARGKQTARNSQTVFNATLQPKLRWTADRDSAAHQAERSLTGSLGLAAAADVVPLLDGLGYAEDFRAAFPSDDEPVSVANYAAALQAYEETLVTPAPFDRFLAGDDHALTDDQLAGLRAFVDVGCAACHQGPLLGGERLEKFGVQAEYWTATNSEKRDAGRYESSMDEADRYVFRVSMLRNIARTGPYFHDGSVEGLGDAVRAMALVQLGADLGEADTAAIAAFLDSLTGDVPAHYAPPADRAHESDRDQ